MRSNLFNKYSIPTVPFRCPYNKKFGISFSSLLRLSTLKAHYLSETVNSKRLIQMAALPFDSASCIVDNSAAHDLESPLVLASGVDSMTTTVHELTSSKKTHRVTRKIKWPRRRAKLAQKKASQRNHPFTKRRVFSTLVSSGTSRERLHEAQLKAALAAFSLTIISYIYTVTVSIPVGSRRFLSALFGSFPPVRLTFPSLKCDQNGS